jgi:hypothetical protein
MVTLTWTKDKLKRFKKVYSKAVAENEESFFFEGNEFVTGYAKYLIEYLSPKFH